MKQVTIIGRGAVGALYGSILHKYLGPENVCFLVDEKRKQRYANQSILVNNEEIAFRYATPQEAGISDLVIVATKNHNINEAIELMKPVVGKDTAILSLLNGIESEQVLGSAFGYEKILYSFAVGLNAVHEGNKISFTQAGRIVFGEKDNRETDRLKAIKKLFDDAGVGYEVPENIERNLWNKFMLNTAYNTISGLLGARYVYLNQPAVRTLAKQVCQEVQAVGKAEGVDLPDSLVEQNHKLVISLGQGKTSMCQDMEAKRKTESQWFTGTIVKLGLKHHIPTPVCETLSLLVQAKEFMFS